MPSPRATPRQKCLTTPQGLNSALQRMDYAVRGELVLRAEALAKRLPGDYPFSRIVYCNIGNPQSVGQKPITFVRQVVAGITHPELLKGDLPDDVVHRVEMLLGRSHGVGAYTESKGLPVVRERVAKALRKRDGVSADPDTIFLTNGASEGVKVLLQMIVRDPNDGVMIPIPQYPLYSATLTALQGRIVEYYLDESQGWRLDVDELSNRLRTAREQGVTVRALCVINPGNPTGQVLTRENLVEIVEFCEREGLVIFADEVYQKNVYVDEKPFVSFKKVVTELGSSVELASFHSVSKGLFGECGMRGGFLEALNMEQEVLDVLYKTLSVSLCSNVAGQVAVDVMMTPPQPGEVSHDLFVKETSDIYGSLKRKAGKLSQALNTFKGVTCNPSEGAMYLFPRVDMPQKAIEESARLGYASADVLYCIELLEATGICTVPGSGFGQAEGTYHFRTTFLPPEDQIDGVVTRMREFHDKFLAKYS
uniref:Alanine transaminase n=1 Tax=Grateloupia turuturu TaxID=118375 RepID=A0A097IU06_9FLOR|nr:alanine transaminase [Grateloupia turuturu]